MISWLSVADCFNYLIQIYGCTSSNIWPRADSLAPIMAQKPNQVSRIPIPFTDARVLMAPNNAKHGF